MFTIEKCLLLLNPYSITQIAGLGELQFQNAFFPPFWWFFFKPPLYSTPAFLQTEEPEFCLVSPLSYNDLLRWSSRHGCTKVFYVDKIRPKPLSIHGLLCNLLALSSPPEPARQGTAVDPGQCMSACREVQPGTPWAQTSPPSLNRSRNVDLPPSRMCWISQKLRIQYLEASTCWMNLVNMGKEGGG